MIVSNNLDTGISFVHFLNEFFVSFSKSFPVFYIRTIAASMSAKKIMRYCSWDKHTI